MNNYQDHMRFFHDKPIDQKYLDEGNYWQLSNNKFIYTAYAMRVGLIKCLAPEQEIECMKCIKENVRHSFMDSVIMSRDEIIGLCYLIPNQVRHEKTLDTWNFSPFQLPKFNPITLVKQLWKIRKKHRNYWWENNLTMVAHVACMVPFQDRAFILRTLNKKVPWYYKLIEWIDKKKKPSSRSSAAIRSFKYNQDNFHGIKDYFPEDHPIHLHIKNNY